MSKLLKTLILSAALSPLTSQSQDLSSLLSGIGQAVLREALKNVDQPQNGNQSPQQNSGAVHTGPVPQRPLTDEEYTKKRDDQYRANDESAARAEQLRRRTNEMQVERERVQHLETQAKEKADRDRKLADLISGKSVPENCVQQWIQVNRNPDTKSLTENEVTEVSLRPPTDPGIFLGRIEEISGQTIRLSGRITKNTAGFAFIPAQRDYFIKNTIITVPKSAKLLQEKSIRIGAVVEGVGTQSGVRTAKLTNGTTLQIAEITASCFGVTDKWVITP